jgi:hypothetical protein
MKRPSLLESFASTVRTYDAVYQGVRDREPLLAAYPTAPALFDALAIDSKLARELRGWLLRLVVVEYQRARHPLWYALAARALDPMLGGLRARLTGAAAERDQAVHLAFAEELGRLRVARPDGPPFPLLTLRRALERALFTAADDRARERDEEEAYFEATRVHTQRPHEDAPQFIECLAHQVGELLVERSGDDGVVRVLAGAETLGEQAERLSTEHVTKACRQRRHHRALERVRGDLSGRQA